MWHWQQLFSTWSFTFRGPIKHEINDVPAREKPVRNPRVGDNPPRSAVVLSSEFPKQISDPTSLGSAAGNLDATL